MITAPKESIIARCPECSMVAGIYVRGGGATRELVCVSCRERPPASVLPTERGAGPSSPGIFSRRRAVGSQSSDMLGVPAAVKGSLGDEATGRLAGNVVSRGHLHRIP